MKAGYVSIIGKANVGKSTLLNRLVGSDLSIITRKPQTTRNRILGIWTKGDEQLLFIDTPGQFKAGNELEKAMQHQIEMAITEADVVMQIIDNKEQASIKKGHFKKDTPVFLIINKIDIMTDKNLENIKKNIDRNSFDEIFYISALRGDNVDKLIPSLLEYVPEEHPLYPETQLSDRPERFFIEEIVRERIFEEYSQEIPYSTAVKVENMKDGKIDIKIFVERESQKGIIIGKGGKKLKKVVSEARKDIEKFLGKHVYMNTWVTVKKKWRKEEEEIKRLGYYG